MGDVKTDIDRELKQEELKKAIADDVGLDEIKEIMNTDDFTIDTEDAVPNYQVKAMSNDFDNDDEESYDSQLGDDDYDIENDEELKHITDHSDGADYEPNEDVASTETSPNKS